MDGYDLSPTQMRHELDSTCLFTDFDLDSDFFDSEASDFERDSETDGTMSGSDNDNLSVDTYLSHFVDHPMRSFDLGDRVEEWRDSLHLLSAAKEDFNGINFESLSNIHECTNILGDAFSSRPHYPFKEHAQFRGTLSMPSYFTTKNGPQRTMPEHVQRENAECIVIKEERHKWD